jgi:hypothetical protein
MLTNDSPQDNGPGKPPPSSEGTPPAATWEEFLQGQGDDVKKLFDGHVQGLKSALDTERTQRKDLTKQLREATAQLEKGSEARQSLEALTGQLEAAQARAEFYEEATRPEIGCGNPRLAFLAAQESGAIDSRGRIAWDALHQQFPELFKKSAAPAGNAGAGTGGPAPASRNMNTFIRRSAGRE